ncbi:MAG: YceI family protein [Saprospiraceae bacterium]|nr:YceI family protein [Saprospiraceae bacterium]
MKSKYLKSVTLIIVTSFLSVSAMMSQTRYASSKAELVLTGTSTMHDWEMKSNTVTSDATFEMEGGKITGVSKMNFNTPAKTLKSGKGGMDKNAYKALKSDKHPDITAVLKSAKVTAKDGKYLLKCKINLTIAGKTLETDLNADAVMNADNTITVSGDKKISMKEYDMSPPSFMLGTVKTGNDVTLKFNVTFSK